MALIPGYEVNTTAIFLAAGSFSKAVETSPLNKSIIDLRELVISSFVRFFILSVWKFIKQFAQHITSEFLINSESHI